MVTNTLLTLALLASPTLAQEAEPEAWPQWRGPERDGQAPGTPWGDDLGSDSLVESWTIEELGPSYSGPIADPLRVYTTETVDQEIEVVRAFDRATGKELWRQSWTGAMEVPFFAARNGSWIRSTPAVDENSLFVVGMRDVLACLDVETGDVRWTLDFTERFRAPLPPFGGVSSPLLDDEYVYVQAGASLVKLAKETGETVWRSMVEGGDAMSGGAFSSPVFAELYGQHQLVVQSRVELVGVDPNKGHQLWSTPVEAFRGMNILTPTIIGDGIFTSSYGGRSHLFQVSANDGGAHIEPVWDGSAQAYMSSPVVVDGHAYIFLRSNRFSCVDLATGETTWTSPPTGDDYWSLAVQGDRILALAETGLMRLIEADPNEYRVLSEREVADSETWAHVAPAGNQIFVRSLDALIALGWK